jgi:hypothetical protein
MKLNKNKYGYIVEICLNQSLNQGCCQLIVITLEDSSMDTSRIDEQGPIIQA